MPAPRNNGKKVLKDKNGRNVQEDESTRRCRLAKMEHIRESHARRRDAFEDTEA